MCTNKTLESKIREFAKLSEEIKAAEDRKKALQAAIIAEYNTRNITEYAPKSGAYNAKLITQQRETVSKKSLAAVLPDTWQVIWNQAAKQTKTEYIRIYN